MNVALLGYGTVGRGVDTIIRERVPSLAVTRILELPGHLTEDRMTSDYNQILADDAIDVVVECMGGIEPAHTYLAAALDAGKSVVTSNKAVVAAHFEEFASRAEATGAHLLIEATCAGGVPWISQIQRVRRIDDVLSFKGIMNGTTNYIIDRMVRDNMQFAEALTQAQRLGYAERDPSADIDGIDVKNKTIIAASVAFDVACTHDLPVAGIRTLAKADLDLFATKGHSIKLLGMGLRRGSEYAVAVMPCAVPLASPEAAVPDNLNLVSLEGTTVGPLKFFGQGAGSLPTGNAIVQDLLDLQAHITPTYDFGAGYAYDPSLIAGDFVLRTTAPVEGAGEFAPGYALLHGITAERACAIWEEARKTDADAFVVSLR